MWSPDLYERTLNFAAEAHKSQLLPGSEINYVSHVCHVCMEAVHAVLSSGKENIDLVMQCALLHDTIEDTTVTYEDIVRVFGPLVAAGVLALTKNEKLPKADQMADSLSRILQQSAEIRIVKMADRTVNLSEPPYYWTSEKRQSYQEEAQVILERLGGVNPFIESRLAKRILDYSSFL
ncbi:MAG: HD domain-containing protein [Saprospiraceae bacterium]